ncbi:LysR family transcriptional regulator [Streptomyces chartreusis]|uniref:LysR family transcriptional regulator n=1 Tax=Streptomyces chartreusis TaxID=1969 RepID=UPI0033E00D30
MLELRHFQILRAVAHEGSIAAAGRALLYAHPTVTHHLANLEAHFNAPLVQRSSKGVVLTEAGAALLPHVEAVLERVRLAEQEVRAMVQHGIRTLRVGIFPASQTSLLSSAASKLLRQGVEVTVREDGQPSLLSALRSRELDVALVFSQPGAPLNLGDSFIAHALLEDPMFLALPADHAQAKLERVPLRALRDERWVIGTNDSDPSTRLLTWACMREGFEPIHAIRTNGHGEQLEFVAAGLGVALVPGLGLDGQRSNIVVRPVDGPALSRQVSVAMLRTSTTDSSGRLLTALRAEVEHIRRGKAACHLP